MQGEGREDAKAAPDTHVHGVVADVQWWWLSVELPAFGARRTPTRTQFAAAPGPLLASTFARSGRSPPPGAA